MSQISVLIIDDDPNIRLSIERAIQLDPDLTLAGSAANGAEGLCIAKETIPDIVLLDLVMPDKDGFAVLKEFQSMQLKEHGTKIVMISSLSDSYEVQKSKSKGAFHYIAKPFDLPSLIENIKDISSYKESSASDSSIQNMFSQPVSIDRRVAEALEALQIPANVKGYLFIKDILVEMVKAPTRLTALSKELYTMVSEKYGDSPPSIERALRTAIKKAWRESKFHNNKLFEIYTDKPPSNGQFLSTVCHHLALNIYS